MSRLLIVLTLLAAVQKPLLAEVLTSFVEQVYSPNPDESRVYISGLVYKLPGLDASDNPAQPALMASNLSILGADQGVDATGLRPATGVEVRFWQPDRPGVFIKVQTDAQGRYVAGLENGVWVAEACGSNQGFYPSSWRLTIENDTLISMQAETIRDIRLDALSPSDLAQKGALVTLSGRGFGCNGELVFTYSNEVNRCGLSQPVDYAHEKIRVGAFVYRSDTQLRFAMPELDANRDVLKHIATVQYQQGNVISPGILIGEQVSPALPEALCLSDQPTAASAGVTVITDSNGQALMVDADEPASDGTQYTATSMAIVVVEPDDVGNEATIEAASFKPQLKRLP